MGGTRNGQVPLHWTLFVRQTVGPSRLCLGTHLSLPLPTRRRDVRGNSFSLAGSQDEFVLAGWPKAPSCSSPVGRLRSWLVSGACVQPDREKEREFGQFSLISRLNVCCFHSLHHAGPTVYMCIITQRPFCIARAKAKARANQRKLHFHSLFLRLNSVEVQCGVAATCLHLLDRVKRQSERNKHDNNNDDNNNSNNNKKSYGKGLNCCTGTEGVRVGEPLGLMDRSFGASMLCSEVSCLN